MKTKNGKIPTPTVGELLLEEFLKPLELTAYRLAKELHVSTTTILDLLHGKRRMTVDLALRLARFFGNSERFWLNVQNSIDVRNGHQRMHHELDRIQPLRQTA